MIHKAKKSLGQNFLKSKEALLAMCTAGDIQKTDTIVEIGPGKGALTTYLLSRSKKVIAIEKDKELLPLLQEKFNKEIEEGKLILVENDVLNFDPKDYELKSLSYKLIANIPYNITGAIIKKFLSEVNQPERMVLLVQKEVAERIVSKDKKESILSLSVKVYGTPKYIMKVSKRFFSPSPKVDSAIIAITDINKDIFDKEFNEDWFFTVLKAGFAHKRKVLRKNLESITTKDKINSIFVELELNPQARPEDIAINTWIFIAKKINNIG